MGWNDAQYQAAPPPGLSLFGNPGDAPQVGMSMDPETYSSPAGAGLMSQGGGMGIPPHILSLLQSNPQLLAMVQQNPNLLSMLMQSPELMGMPQGGMGGGMSSAMPMMPSGGMGRPMALHGLMPSSGQGDKGVGTNLGVSIANRMRSYHRPPHAPHGMSPFPKRSISKIGSLR